MAGTAFNELMDERDLLDFSQNFAVTRNYVGSRLFPDQKAQYLQASYARLAQNAQLPQIAEVHGHDTEAVIASRVPFERVNLEKLLIKQKINQTEAIREILAGIEDTDVTQYVFDDIARMAETVVARVEKAKIDAITQGKFIIDENNLAIDIDYGIPQDNFVKTWWDEDADIIGDIRDWTDQAEEQGLPPTIAVTTRKVLRKIQANKGIQKLIFGVSYEGMSPTLQQVNALLQDQTGVTIIIDEDKYATPSTEGKLHMVQNRFFPEDTFVLLAEDNRGRVGVGLWGVTPEERVQNGSWTSLSERQFVTISQWTTQDPVAVWTKASGLFVPVLPNPYSHIIANIADEGSKVSQLSADVKVADKTEKVG